MKLKRFRVYDFRSVHDSGWIDVDETTALIGVNESGKTNLLLPLWKLNPVREGDIQPTSDYPKKLFGEIRENPSGFRFIEAEFVTGSTASQIAHAADITPEEAARVRVSRSFDRKYTVEFPDHQIRLTVEREWLVSELSGCSDEVNSARALKQEDTLQCDLSEGLLSIADGLPKDSILDVNQLTSARDAVDDLVPESSAKTSKIVPIVQRLLDRLAAELTRLSAPAPGNCENVVNTVVSMLPSFVYYSNYGNLDSEIYLPHVVENLDRDDLGTREAAKARTLRVLFSFVRLEAKEILELGRDFQEESTGRTATQEEIDEITEKKRTRSILLQAASATLTEKFRDWWKQGDYRFRFEADGNHFRIWVADDRRPTEVELENRSSGLQWFLSFYLVFLVESKGAFQQSVLLLDEPGMSLHPLGQRDLSAFFESLSEVNQIIYTSHSPFLVDADRLERARKVYVAADGTTKATPDLRHQEGKDKQAGAAYAVHSALNLSVAESFLLGCHPVLVEGASDQHYLTAIKMLLISEGKIRPSRELVFPPSGGAKTARVVASILTGRDEKLPMILLDDDEPGRRMKNQLVSTLYAKSPERVLSIVDYVDFEGAEIEDLFPPDFLADELDRIEREPEVTLADTIKPGVPFVAQVEKWAQSQSVNLDKYWKVKLSIRAKRRALSRSLTVFDGTVVERWVKLFKAFT